MDNQDKAELLNQIFVTEADGDGEVLYYALAENSERNRKILNSIGYSDKWINENAIFDSTMHEPNEYIDLCLLAWDFCEWYSGEDWWPRDEKVK